MDAVAAALTVKEHHFNPGAIHEDLLDGQYPAVVRTVGSVLKPGASILDFGSGACDIPALLATLGYTVEAADDLQDDWHTRPGSREAICAFARRMGVKFHVLDGHPWPWKPESFDMVMLHHVLEHLHDSPRELLNSLLELVRPDGYLFITVPNAGNLRKRIDLLRGRSNLPEYGSFFWSGGPWRGHVREYVRPDLERLSAYLGLRTVELGAFHSMTRVLPRPVRPVWKALTALNPAWRDTWLLLAQKPADWQPAVAPTLRLAQPRPARAVRPALRAACGRARPA
jgi:SAM-dependent methyltransferase